MSLIFLSGLKKQIYQDTFRTPDYFWFDPNTLEFCGFHWVDGQYRELLPDDRGWRWSEQLQLFLGIQDEKLRFFTPNGQLVQMPQESAVLERQRAEKAEALLALYQERFGDLADN